MRKRVLSHESEKIYIIYLLGIFFLAQLLYYLAHSGFSNFGGIDRFVVDLHTMKEHFWQTLFYYHISPPLHIFYVAIFIFLFPPNGELGFYLFHSILGIYAFYSLYQLQRRLDVSPLLATLLVTFFILSPSFNLQQSTASYDFPTACLLVISTWHFSVFIDNPRFLSALNFFMMVALLCSIRSLYHVILYMLPIIMLTTFALRKHWKIILLASVLPFLFVFSIYVKNYLLFNAFTTSSYFGETLDTVAMQFTVNLKQREEGIKQGFFSNLALCPSSADTTRAPTPTSKYGGWDCYRFYAAPYRKAYMETLKRDYQNIPILSCEYVKLSSIENSEMPIRSCVGNIGMSKEYGKNALQAIIHYPFSYLAGITAAWNLYFKSTVSYFFEINGNVRHIPTMMGNSWLSLKQIQLPIFLFVFPLLLFFAITSLFHTRNRTLAWSLVYTIISSVLFKKLYDRNFMLLLGLFLGMLVLQFASRVWWKHKSFFDQKKWLIIGYMICNIIFTSLIITSLVGFAQQRYRFYIDGLYLVLFGLFIQTLFDWFNQQRRRLSNSSYSSRAIR